MFSKVLVANRGEIALRIIRSCREMGIRTVAVYSEADARSLPVEAADEKVCIGPPPSRKSYLDGERLIQAAKASGAEALHPGYGYLAENDSSPGYAGRKDWSLSDPQRKISDWPGKRSPPNKSCKRPEYRSSPGAAGESARSRKPCESGRRSVIPFW